MNSGIKNFSLLSLFLLLLFLLVLTGLNSAAAQYCPLLWNIDNLSKVKASPSKYKVYSECIKEANQILNDKPVTVTNKNKYFGSNKHNYSSIAPYWWPNPENPEGEYIFRDGVVNPEVSDYDVASLDDMCKRLRVLSIAFFLTEKEEYYQAYLKQLRAWFINRRTYMTPQLEYAQVIKGHNRNKGSGAGLVTVDNFHTVLESFRLVDMIKPVDRRTKRKTVNWFSQFLNWMLCSDLGSTARKGNSNIALLYDVAALDIALFVDNKEVVKYLSDEFRRKRLEKQIKPDGSQPNELSRSKAFSYSIYNLTHIIDFCIIQESTGNEYYSQNKEIIDSATLFLTKYLGNQDKFKYSQISTSWTSCEHSLRMQVYRLKRLMPNDNPSYNFSDYLVKDLYNNIDYILY